MKLGPYSVSVGLTEDILRNKGPYPNILERTLTNGLVIELARHAKLCKFQDTVVATWLHGLGVTHRNTHHAVWQLYSRRNDLRKRKATGDIAILESAQFEPTKWPVDEQAEAPLEVVESSRKIHEKQDNVLHYEIKKKEKHLQTLTGQIDGAKDELAEVKRKTGHYSARNVNRRDKRSQLCREELTNTEKQCKELRGQLETLQKERDFYLSQNEQLSQDIEKLKGELVKANDKLEKSQGRSRNTKRRLLRLSKKKDLCPKCDRLQSELLKKDDALTALQDREYHAACDSIHVSDLRSKDGSYSASVRLCICELIGLEVSAEKIPHVIQSVARHFFSHTFNIGELPSRNTCINIANEGAEVVKDIYTKKLEETSTWGLHKDGTTRKKQKILDASITFPSGEEFNLGFSLAASETSKTICNDVITKLTELSSHSQNPDNFTTKIASTLSYLMNDRAANEKKSNEFLTEWRDSMVQQHPDQKQEIFNLFCMAHVLLGFQNYILKGLEEHQKAVSTDGSGRIGRDKTQNFSSFKRLQAASRTCKSASDVFAPVGDYRGLRNIWDAYCKENNIKSTITNYKDNRFNGLFSVSASIVHHHTDFLHVLNSAEQSNAVLRGLKADLEDDSLMDIVRALAVTYVKITHPYWNMVTTTNYSEVVHPIRALYKILLDAVADPSTLLTTQPIGCLEQWTSPKLLDRLESWHIQIDNCAMSPVIKGLVTCFQTQLSDILNASETSLSALDAVSFAPSTNLCVERRFGDLDSSQRRRPNASLHYHSSFVNLKHHHPKLTSYMSSMSHKEKQNFFIKMRYLAKKHKLQHKKHNEDVSSLILKKLRTENARPKILKKAKKICRTKHNETLRSVEISAATPGSWVAVAYHDTWYPGVVQSVSGASLTVDFAYPCKGLGNFKWPDGKDLHPVDAKFVIAVKLPISVRSNGRFLHVDNFKELMKLHKGLNLV